MESNPLSTLRHDRRTIALHWITAGLVAALWVAGQTIDAFPKGTPRVFARSAHITLGVVLALVLTHRIWWRLSGGTRLPPTGTGRLDAIASLTHKLLYVLLVATILLGMANAWVRGDELFTLFTIPAFDPGNRDLREQVAGLHEIAANAVLVVALFHAAAGLLHHFVWKDEVLRRMLPTRRAP